MTEEYTYEVDENDEVIRKVSRTELNENLLLHRESCILVLNSKNEILITKRTMSKNIYPGLLEIGQGGLTDVDESYDSCAKRELEEETGIKDTELKFIFDFRWKGEHNNAFIKIYKCVYDGEITPQLEEISDYFFISFEKLDKMIKEESNQFCPDCIDIFKKFCELT